MISIKDVALEAGVSTATVSRVLANKPHVSPKLKQKVWTAVEKLDYRPNLIARSLRSQKSSTLGLIVSDIRNPFFTAISRAVEDTAHKQGYSVFLCNTDEDPEKELLYLNLMQDEHVAGLIFSPTRHSAEHFADLHIHFPTVIIDRQVTAPNVDMVLIDNVMAGYTLANHLLENGYRRIGGLFGEASTTGRLRRQGLEQALREFGLEPMPELMQFVAPKIETGREPALALLDTAVPPDALFTTNSLLTAGALMAIRERQLHIPQDIALVGFDETIWSQLVEPPVTLVAQPTEEIGRTATELLLKRIANPERSMRQVILQTSLLVRGSSLPSTSFQ
ncbi:MAG: LacI family DNA-binding transcriptional regulator [Anaerolineales bacterium]|nr:LacI family DNA-binding transcriptional regulator [Anaerolineales bacterium]